MHARVPSVTKGSYFVMEVSYEKEKNGANIDAERKTDYDLNFIFSGNLSYIEVPSVSGSQQLLHPAARQQELAGAAPSLTRARSPRC